MLALLPLVTLKSIKQDEQDASFNSTQNYFNDLFFDLERYALRTPCL